MCVICNSSTRIYINRLRWLEAKMEMSMIDLVLIKRDKLQYLRGIG